MKRSLALRKLLPFIILFFLSLAACKKDKNNLPPETQTGTGTFGCRIDGKVWVPRGKDPNTGQNIFISYKPVFPGAAEYTFYVTASNFDSDPIEGVGIVVDSMKLVEGMRLPLRLRRRALNGWGIFARIGTSEHKTTDLHTGELHITRLNDINQVISGTFWFDAINAAGEIIHVTEGRFDVKFTR